VRVARITLRWLASPERSALRSPITACSEHSGNHTERYCTVIVTRLLVMLFSVALTVICVPAVALELTVALPLPCVKVRSVVSETFHATEVVTSSAWLVPENVPRAVNVMVVPWVGVVVEGVSAMDNSDPGVTVIVAVEALTVPKLALIVVVQIAVTVCAALTRPVVGLTPAQVGVPDDQSTFPVRSFVVPSL